MTGLICHAKNRFYMAFNGGQKNDFKQGATRSVLGDS